MAEFGTADITTGEQHVRTPPGGPPDTGQPGGVRDPACPCAPPLTAPDPGDTPVRIKDDIQPIRAVVHGDPAARAIHPQGAGQGTGVNSFNWLPDQLPVVRGVAAVFPGPGGCRHGVLAVPGAIR